MGAYNLSQTFALLALLFVYVPSQSEKIQYICELLAKFRSWAEFSAAGQTPSAGLGPSDLV